MDSVIGPYSINPLYKDREMNMYPYEFMSKEEHILVKKWKELYDEDYSEVDRKLREKGILIVHPINSKSLPEVYFFKDKSIRIDGYSYQPSEALEIQLDSVYG